MTENSPQKSRMTIWCLTALIMVICAVALGVILFFTPGHGQPSRKNSQPAGLTQ